MFSSSGSGYGAEEHSTSGAPSATASPVLRLGPRRSNSNSSSSGMSSGAASPVTLGNFASGRPRGIDVSNSSSPPSDFDGGMIPLCSPSGEVDKGQWGSVMASTPKVSTGRMLQGRNLAMQYPHVKILVAEESGTRTSKSASSCCLPTLTYVAVLLFFLFVQ